MDRVIDGIQTRRFRQMQIDNLKGVPTTTRQSPKGCLRSDGPLLQFRFKSTFLKIKTQSSE